MLLRIAPVSLFLALAACGGRSDDRGLGNDPDDDPNNGGSGATPSGMSGGGSVPSGMAGTSVGDPVSGTCVPMGSPSEVIFDGQLLFGSLQIEPHACQSSVSVWLSTCPSDVASPTSCVQLSVSQSPGTPVDGFGQYYDPSGLAFNLVIGAGNIDVEALREGRAVEMSIAGLFTTAEGGVRPFELSAAGCPNELQRCLI